MTAAPAFPPFKMADPVRSTPPRRLGSVRRTTTHDSARHEGMSGPVTVVARGRDLVTAADGGAVVRDEARLDVVADYATGRVIHITGEPADPGIELLTDSRLLAKFRLAIDQALPGETTSSSVRFQLLDDLPTALLMSGRVLRAAGIAIGMSSEDKRPRPTDVCAGWVTGGMAVTGSTDIGPPLFQGPVAPIVESADDPLAWHALAPLAPHSTRRRRRLDIWEEHGRARLDCFFRDSHVDKDGIETVVHEWRVVGELDPSTHEFVACHADMGPLPFAECPSAAASVERLIGAPVDGLRRSIRKTFVGPSTCTHLNDTLRSFEDVDALLDALREERAE